MRAEEMVKADLEQCGLRRVSGNVAADVVLDAIRAHHHGQRVPADDALDAPLNFLVAGEGWLPVIRNGVDVGRVG